MPKFYASFFCLMFLKCGVGYEVIIDKLVTLWTVSVYGLGSRALDEPYAYVQDFQCFLFEYEGLSFEILLMWRSLWRRSLQRSSANRKKVSLWLQHNTSLEWFINNQTKQVQWPVLFICFQRLPIVQNILSSYAIMEVLWRSNLQVWQVLDCNPYTWFFSGFQQTAKSLLKEGQRPWVFLYP